MYIIQAIMQFKTEIIVIEQNVLLSSFPDKVAKKLY
jgi:hypothetical protein